MLLYTAVYTTIYIVEPLKLDIQVPYKAQPLYKGHPLNRTRSISSQWSQQGEHL